MAFFIADTSVNWFPELFYPTGSPYLVFLLQSPPTEGHNSNSKCSLISPPCLDLNIFARPHTILHRVDQQSSHRESKASLTSNSYAIKWTDALPLTIFLHACHFARWSFVQWMWCLACRCSYLVSYFVTLLLSFTSPWLSVTCSHVRK